MKRIEEIAKYVFPYKVIADVGCDHGYTIKCAFDKYQISKAYAIDNKIGPLNVAIENLREYENVIFSNSDGLTEVGNDTEVLIISGMGGDLIRDILESHQEKLASLKKIIIEANSKDKVVRQYLLTHGFTLEAEEIVIDDLYYLVDVFKLGEHDYNDIEIKYGPILVREKPIEFVNYWHQKIEELENQNNIYTTNKAMQIKKDLGL